MKTIKQVNKFIHVKILLFLLCIVLVISSCFKTKQRGNTNGQSIIDKNILVNIEELYGASKIDDYKEILRIDSITSIVADSLIEDKKKYEIIYYFHNRVYGVDSWERIRFDDKLGSKVSYCHSDKKIQKSYFQVENLRSFVNDKEKFNNKFSYNISYIKGYRKYLVFKENGKIIFCDILITSLPDENFDNTSFINNYLKSIEESCK